jgi:hypothetical protein
MQCAMARWIPGNSDIDISCGSGLARDAASKFNIDID